MARGRKSTPEHVVKQCFYLQPDLKTYSAIGREVNLAPNTVKSILTNKSNIASYGTILQEIAEINDKSHLMILEQIKSVKYSTITSNIIDIFNKDNLDKEFDSNGIRSLVSLLGNTIDKAFKVENLKLRQKELNLKEKELDLRITNPESFTAPVIIADIEGGERYANKVKRDNSTTLPQ